MKKRGLSSVVTTIIIILIVLVAIAIVWGIVRGLMDKSARQLSIARITVDMQLDSAEVNYYTGIATVRVTRNSGAGNVTGVKIMIDDGKTVEVFDRRFNLFNEGSSKTILLNLSESSELILYNINKISVAPIIILESGEEVVGIQSKAIGGLNKGLNKTIDTLEPNETQCIVDSQCGTNTWIDPSFCSQDTTQVMQYEKTWKCQVGICTSSTDLKTKETCSSGTTCYGGNCIAEQIKCTSETINQVCGLSGTIGNTKCNNGRTAIVQDYRNRSCISGTCSEEVSSRWVQDCPPGEVCGTTSLGASCYVPLECASNSDCDLGEICVEGKCVIEVVMNAGTISSIWPFFVGEYFDSPSLPKTEEDYTNRYIIFPGSQENRCMKITEHVYPNKTGANAYVRLNETITNISTGDSYQIWETEYSCTLV